MLCGTRPSRSAVFVLVQNHAFQRVAFIFPGAPLKRTPCMRIARLQSRSNAGRAEIDILGMIFIVQPRSQQAHNVHARSAAVFRQVLHDRVAEARLRHELRELGEEVLCRLGLDEAREAKRRRGKPAKGKKATA